MAVAVKAVLSCMFNKTLSDPKQEAALCLRPCGRVNHGMLQVFNYIITPLIAEFQSCHIA